MIENSSITEVAMDDVVLVPLCRRDGSIRAYAIIDCTDAEWVSQWKWHLSSCGYACRSGRVNGKRRSFFLHRELLGLKYGDGMEGDHEDRNPLNCRRSNLRAIPKVGKPNNQNKSSHRKATSKYRGVHWDKRLKKWMAQISINHKSNHLGCFESELEAAQVAQMFRQALLPYSVDQIDGVEQVLDEQTVTRAAIADILKRVRERKKGRAA